MAFVHNKDGPKQARRAQMVGFLRCLLRDFHPAVSAFDLLLNKQTLNLTDRAVLAESFFKLISLLGLQSPPAKVFENTRLFLGMLSQCAEPKHEAFHSKEKLLLQCSLTMMPLHDPVNVPGTTAVCNRESILAHLVGGASYNAVTPKYPGVTASDLVVAVEEARVAAVYQHLNEFTMWRGWKDESRAVPSFVLHCPVWPSF